jgi:Tfp pilus assembly protein PilO
MNLSIIKQIAMVRKKSLLFLAGGVFLSIVVNLFISTYQEPRLAKVKSEWLQQNAAEKRGIAELSRDEVYKIGQADLAKFNARIYPKTHFARFIGELYEIAGKHRLEVSSITYQPVTAKESKLLQYTFDIAVVGNYNQLKMFLNDLDLSVNLLHIDSISFSNQENKSDQVKLQVKSTAYFRREAQ